MAIAVGCIARWLREYAAKTALLRREQGALATELIDAGVYPGFAVSFADIHQVWQLLQRVGGSSEGEVCQLLYVETC